LAAASLGIGVGAVGGVSGPAEHGVVAAGAEGEQEGHAGDDEVDAIGADALPGALEARPAVCGLATFFKEVA
jgi:hypothetical protein